MTRNPAEHDDALEANVEKLLSSSRPERRLPSAARQRILSALREESVASEPVERRSMAQHIERLMRAGRVREPSAGAFQVVE